MTIAQYKAVEAHVSFWGALIAALIATNVLAVAVFLIFAGVQMVRQLYWYKQMFKEQP